MKKSKYQELQSRKAKRDAKRMVKNYNKSHSFGSEKPVHAFNVILNKKNLTPLLEKTNFVRKTESQLAIDRQRAIDSILFPHSDRPLPNKSIGETEMRLVASSVYGMDRRVTKRFPLTRAETKQLERALIVRAATMLIVVSMDDARYVVRETLKQLRSKRNVMSLVYSRLSHWNPVSGPKWVRSLVEHCHSTMTNHNANLFW